MGRYTVYAVRYTAREPYGEWLSHDEKRINGYSDPKDQVSYYVAQTPEAAEAHWRYWSKYSSPRQEVTFVSVERIDAATVLLEL